MVVEDDYLFNICSVFFGNFQNFDFIAKANTFSKKVVFLKFYRSNTQNGKNPR